MTTSDWDAMRNEVMEVVHDLLWYVFVEDDEPDEMTMPHPFSLN